MRTTDLINIWGFEFANDIAFWPFYAWGFMTGLIILAASVMAHEIGHWFAFKKIVKKDVKFVREGLKFKVGQPEDYIGLSEKQYIGIVGWGVAFGLIPIVISGVFFTPLLLMVIPYGWGARKDIQQLMERVKLEDN